VPSTAWPRPSDSRRVRLALYLLEGVTAGGAVVLGAGLLLGLSRIVVDAAAGEALAALLLLLVAVALARARLVAADRGSGPTPAEPYRDWRRVRRPELVVAVALSLAGVLLAGAAALGDVATAGRVLGASTLVLAVVGYAVVLHRLGVRL
jgi:small-conductance mechanosensitive channel